LSAVQELIEDSGATFIRWALGLLSAAVVAYVLLHANWHNIAGLDFGAVWTYRVALFNGLLVTLGLTIVAAVVGILAGTILAMASQAPFAPLRWLVVAYVELFRDTPMLVQLMWIHFALPLLTGFNTTPVESGVIAIALHAAAYFTEVMRAGIQSVPRSQWDASYALGLPARTRWMRVILPPAIRTVLPPLASLTISFFKGTAILSVLQIGELMSVAGRISNATFRPVEIFSFVALIYLIIGYTFSRLAARLERHLARSESHAA
jgi:polar amino acid transport system permease protein